MYKNILTIIITQFKVRTLNILRKLIILSILTFSTNASAAIEVFEWMTQSIVGLGSLFHACLTVPPFANFYSSSQVLNIAQSGEWISTGSDVTKDRLIKFDWSTRGITTRPRKHLVLFRIDPRFERPQVFIQTYDYNTGRYISDFHTFKAGELIRYQNSPDMAFKERIADYTQYFNFTGRDKIPVYAGDVVNVTLLDRSNDFFVANGDFNNELQNLTNKPFTIIYTNSEGLKNNTIIYANANIWCNFIVGSVYYAQFAKCNNSGYFNSGEQTNSILLGTNYVPFNDVTNNIPPCASGANGINVSPLCSYDKGRGMQVKIGGTVIKPTASSFLNTGITGKWFFYYKTPTAGGLDFTTDGQIQNMFVNFPQSMKDWSSYTNASDLINSISNGTFNIYAKFVHFGRYMMSLEIGNGDNSLSVEEQDAIKVEYTIATSQPPTSFSGTEVQHDDRVDADQDGVLWLRVINPNSQVQGSVTVNYAYYSGSTIFSDILYNKLIKPLTDKFQDLSKLVYTKLVTNTTMRNIAQVLLSLYIAFYALWFLAGATQVTVQDLVIRISKIVIIFTLFSNTSWTFFNTYLFQGFTQGISYLMTQVVGVSSSVNNIFGFIDPIFDRYTNPRIWGLLFIQLLQIHNGLALFAIMTIYSMLTFFRAVLEVIIGYCLAFIGLTVMISLAPFFLTLMLFEQTRSIYDNWFSALFDYMIQPTILLIFFLIIDQLIGRQITDVVTQACWGCLIPLEIALDLRHIGIPLDFSFKLPFLDCIPFFVTDISDVHNINDVFVLKGSFLFLVTSTLLFYCYCTMAKGLVEYVTRVTSMLTNVMPARREGNIQQAPNATADIISDIGQVFSPIKSAGAVFKDKVIDQNYQVNNRSSSNRKGNVSTYVGKIYKSRGEVHNADDGEEGGGK